MLALAEDDLLSLSLTLSLSLSASQQPLQSLVDLRSQACHLDRGRGRERVSRGGSSSTMLRQLSEIFSGQVTHNCSLSSLATHHSMLDNPGEIMSNFCSII